MQRVVASLFALALSAGAVSQRSCVQLPQSYYWGMGEHTRIFQYHSLKAQHFAHIEWLPFGTGVGALIYFSVHPYAVWYGERKLWIDPLPWYGWEAPVCHDLAWHTLAIWWDDRENLPRNDNMYVGARRGIGPVFINLRNMPTGMLAATDFPLCVDPWIERQQYPPDWNTEFNKPRYFAAFVAPTRGWW